MGKSKLESTAAALVLKLVRARSSALGVLDFGDGMRVMDPWFVRMAML